MTSKKDLIIAVLATFCLTATLFLMMSTRSQTPLGTYDPWIDNNHDGTINILDAIILGNHFLTSGDPTINVNVTNFPTEAPYRIQTITLTCFFDILINDSQTGIWYHINYTETPTIYVGGYSRMYIYLVPPNASDTTQYTVANYNVTHAPISVDWITEPSSSFVVPDYFSSYPFNITASVNRASNPPLYTVYSQISDNPIQIKSPYIRLHIYSHTLPFEELGWMNMTLKIFLRNE